MRWTRWNFKWIAVFSFFVLVVKITWNFTFYNEVKGEFHKAVTFDTLLKTKDRRYKIWNNVWKPRYAPRISFDVGIATQCSVNNLNHLFQLVSYWKASISVAVFVSGDQLQYVLKYLSRLVKCHSNIVKYVSVHIVIPVSHPPFEKILYIRDEEFARCPIIHKNTNLKNYDMQEIPYPVNVLRNVAVTNLHTSHVLVLDIDMIPNQSLYRDLLKSNLLNDNAIVIPAFEIKHLTIVPKIKRDLIQLWDKRDIRPFYEKVCWKCQKYTDYARWRHNQDDVMTYIIDWHDPWEPFYVVKRKHVTYDERFEQYGFNRISQLCDMYMKGFQFHVYNHGFLLHAGFKEKHLFHSKKDEDNERNKIYYRVVKNEMLKKHPNTQRRC